MRSVGFVLVRRLDQGFHAGRCDVALAASPVPARLPAQLMPAGKPYFGSDAWTNFTRSAWYFAAAAWSM